MAEHDTADRDTEDGADEPGREKPAAEAGERREPTGGERQHVANIAVQRQVAVVIEQPDRREEDDRQRIGEGEPGQKKRRAPRKSLVRTGTIRTSLREFGASIIMPPPIAIETWPTTGLS